LMCSKTDGETRGLRPSVATVFHRRLLTRHFAMGSRGPLLNHTDNLRQTSPTSNCRGVAPAAEVMDFVARPGV
jgi:hypothetical protein